MGATLEAKLGTALVAYAPLVALLATAPDGEAAVFEQQEYQGALFPSMTFFLVSSVPVYGASFRGAIDRSRVQFTIWDTDPESARAVETELMNFLDQFDAYSGHAGGAFRPNQVVMRRQGGNPQTQPLTYWRMLDAVIYNNENL